MHIPELGQVEHLHQHVPRTVRHRGLVAQPVLEREDVLALDLPHHERSEHRHDMLVEHEAVAGGGRGLVVHIDVFTQISLGEVGRRRGKRIRLQRLADLEPRDEQGDSMQAWSGESAP